MVRLFSQGGETMNKRVLIGGILGGDAMYAWTFIAHMFLPLGEAGIRQIDNEQGLLAQMSSTLNEYGMYMFPRMPPDGDQARYQQSVAAGPSGLLIYFPRRNFNFGASLAVEFVVELLQAWIVVFLLSLTPLATYAKRAGFFALAGVAVVIATNLSYWNWYGFPATYTAANMFTGWMGYVCAGLAVAAFDVNSTRLAGPAQ
jgi:hypothetical protein